MYRPWLVTPETRGRGANPFGNLIGIGSRSFNVPMKHPTTMSNTVIRTSDLYVKGAVRYQMTDGLIIISVNDAGTLNCCTVTLWCVLVSE